MAPPASNQVLDCRRHLPSQKPNHRSLEVVLDGPSIFYVRKIIIHLAILIQPYLDLVTKKRASRFSSLDQVVVAVTLETLASSAASVTGYYMHHQCKTTSHCWKENLDFKKMAYVLLQLVSGCRHLFSVIVTILCILFIL